MKKQQTIKALQYLIEKCESGEEFHFIDNICKFDNGILKYKIGEFVNSYIEFNQAMTLLDKPKPQLTHNEKAFVEEYIKDGYEWCSRDLCNEIFCYKNKPSKCGEVWNSDMYNVHIPKHLFRFIQWSDEEPTGLKELLK